MEYEDINDLPSLSNESVLELLKVRYDQDSIYTWASTTLIAVNPFKNLPKLYYHSVNDGYRHFVNDEDSNSGIWKPHIYSIAESALQYLSKDASTENVSIIVSGESGSGKTENTKHLLSYITLAGSQLNVSQKAIEQHILAVNPILEAFGNATTPCNDNSSRFGKYIILQFDRSSCLIGAHIQTYLLEKTRVVHRANGNANFHVFYQMLEGLSTSDREEYLIGKSKRDFNYLEASNMTGNNNRGEAHGKLWHSLMKALADIGIAQAELTCVVKLLSAILHLGNIGIVPDEEDGSAIDDEAQPSVDQVCSLLSLTSSEALIKALTYRLISTAQAKRKSVFYKPCHVVDSRSRRDCLAKTLYVRLFDWLVKKINSSIKSASQHSFIGLLDIYGFESFATNSLEQLCINYANERLQHYFIKYYLSDIQLEYEAEGLPWKHINTDVDNNACVQTLSGIPGIFSTLNEECALNRVGPADTQAVCEKLSSLSQSSTRFTCGMRDVRALQFTVHHYASRVTYCATGLAEKNKDSQPADLVAILLSSTNPIIQEILSSGEEDQANAPTQTKKTQTKRTVFSKFKKSLDGLVSILRSTECQYVRCIKPSSIARPQLFDKHHVINQLQACGVLETVLIRSQVHAARMPYAQFVNIYGILLPTSSSHKPKTPSKSHPDDKIPYLITTSNKENITPRSARRQSRLSVRVQAPEVLVEKIASKPVAKAKCPLRSKCMKILRHVLEKNQTMDCKFGSTKLFISSQATVDILSDAIHGRRDWAARVMQAVRRRQIELRRVRRENRAALRIQRAIRSYITRIRAADELAATPTPDSTLPDLNTSEIEDSSPYPPYSITNAEMRNEAEVINLILRETPDISHQPASSCILEPCNGSRLFRNLTVFYRSKLVSIRRYTEKIVFHTEPSMLLKESHKCQSLPTSSLLDCLEDSVRALYLRS